MPQPTSRLPAHRARDLSIVVWATTVGSVLGPNLVGPSAPVARRSACRRSPGRYVFSLIGLLLAIAVVSAAAAPRPLLEARRRRVADGDDSGPAHGSVTPRAAGRRRHPGRPAGAGHPRPGARGDGQRHGDDPAAHVPRRRRPRASSAWSSASTSSGCSRSRRSTGLAVDRFGGRAVAVVGSVILSAATLLASASPEGGSPDPRAGLFLLGLGLVVHPRRPGRRCSRRPSRSRAAGCAGGLRPGHGAGRRARRGARRAWSSTGRASRRWRCAPCGGRRGRSAWSRRSARCAPTRPARWPCARGPHTDPPRSLTGGDRPRC